MGEFVDGDGYTWVDSEEYVYVDETGDIVGVVKKAKQYIFSLHTAHIFHSLDLTKRVFQLGG